MGNGGWVRGKVIMNIIISIRGQSLLDSEYIDERVTHKVLIHGKTVQPLALLLTMHSRLSLPPINTTQLRQGPAPAKRPNPTRPACQVFCAVNFVLCVSRAGLVVLELQPPRSY